MNFGGRWLDQGTKFTELDITRSDGRQATIILEDDGNWNFIISGSVNGGKKQVNVDSSKDFDIHFQSDGSVEFTVLNGRWSRSQGSVVRLDILPFKK